MCAIWIDEKGKIIDDKKDIDFTETVWGDVLRELGRKGVKK